MTKLKTKCEYCGKLALCTSGSFDNKICSTCYKDEREKINQHHKDVGLSCYCGWCM